MVHNKNKNRMVVDYSEMINKFTYLEVYLLPNIDNLANTIAKYKIFSSLDLKSAYHLVPLPEEDRPYTAFEADGVLYQFKRVCFGLTNGVAAFQRIIDEIIRSNDLKGVYAYLDDVIACGDTQQEHDENLSKFMEVTRRYNILLNDGKSILSSWVICILGYEICHNELQPDPSRLEALENMPLPEMKKSLQRMTGLFAYYSHYSERIRPLVDAAFPLPKEAVDAISDIKRAICSSVKTAVDENLPFTVETDASNYTTGATLNQDWRPVAFFSRFLGGTEQKHCAVEKETYAIIESERKWHHYLSGKHFT